MVSFWTETMCRQYVRHPDLRLWLECIRIKLEDRYSKKMFFVVKFLRFRNLQKNLIWKADTNSFHFLTFPACFKIPIIFSNLNYNCSNLLDLRNLQKQVKKAFCYQRYFWPLSVRTNCSSDLKMFADSQPSASKIKSFSRSLEQFFLTVGQNNFGNHF